jgi:lysozyme family protein
MPTYIRKPTQEDRILELLRLRGRNGVESWEIPTHLHILQYNSRIFGLRKKGYIIDNINDRFYLKFDPQFDKSGQGRFL